MFMGLLISILNASNHTKCFSLSNQKCLTEPTLFNLHPNKYSQELDWLNWIDVLEVVILLNTPNELSSKICIPNKTEDLNLRVFNMLK